MGTESTDQRYADWKAPREDGAALVWPGLAEIVGRGRENHRILDRAEGVLVQGAPLPGLRRAMRAFVGHADDGQLLIATGHQTELYHAGVWAKLAVINAVANRCVGNAVHFAVDSDEPKHLALRWPGESEPVTDDAAVATAAWSALVGAPTPAHLKGLREKLQAASAGWSFRPVALDLLDAMAPLAMNEEDLARTLTNAMHKLDWEQFGMRHAAFVTSPIWGSPGYLTFAYHLLARAGELAAKYNGALADYREAEGIKSTGRPMPDLRVSDGEVESPFWLDDLATGSRQRLALVRGAAGTLWRLRIGAAEFELDPRKDADDAARELAAFLRQANHRIAPRALTLTMFLRLFVADQWVHGIGGGRYDQVTDRLIASFFGVEPPRFAVATGTLYFPDAVGRSRACLPCVKQEGHRLKHSILGARKLELVGKIAAAPRGSMERQRVFAEMHKALAEAMALPEIAQWEQRLEETQQAAEQDRVLFDRELFYGLQSGERLKGLIAKVAV